MDLRGHEHVVEVAVFAPANAGAAIRELAGLVRVLKFRLTWRVVLITRPRLPTARCEP
jgi:hypothetical protein